MLPDTSEAHPTRVDFAAASQKRQLRRRARSRREEWPPDELSERDLARYRLVLPMVPRHAVVAIYLSAGQEPGTTALAAVLWRRGHRLLVPRLLPSGSFSRTPHWAWYEGPSQLREGFRGIPEPMGPPLEGEVLAHADVVVVSGLAATLEGHRVGAGAGWFDRALVHARPGAEVWLLVNEEEIVDQVPVEPHDRRVTKVITDQRVITCS